MECGFLFQVRRDWLERPFEKEEVRMVVFVITRERILRHEDLIRPMTYKLLNVSLNP